MNNVYKILREYEWEEAKESGQITTALDKQDGFIHLSTASQLAATLAFFFKESDSLQLLQLNLDKIDETQLMFTENPSLNLKSRIIPSRNQIAILLIFANAAYTYTGEYTVFIDGEPGSRANPELGDFGVLDFAVDCATTIG